MVIPGWRVLVDTCLNLILSCVDSSVLLTALLLDEVEVAGDEIVPKLFAALGRGASKSGDPLTWLECSGEAVGSEITSTGVRTGLATNTIFALSHLPWSLIQGGRRQSNIRGTR